MIAAASGNSRIFEEEAAALVHRLTGLVFPEIRRPALLDGLRRAMRRAGVSDPSSYLAELERDVALLDDLVGEITVGETYFFRVPEQFACVRDEILPALRRRSVDRCLRIWSAGCSTGEEAYTLAIVARESGLENRARILATDISRAALAHARRARYTSWSLRGVPPDIVSRYFERNGSRFDLIPDVRRMVEFRYLNLAEDTYPALSTGAWGLDLILCRNVLIYFDPATAARVVRRCLDALTEDGWLLLGPSDPTTWESMSAATFAIRGGPVYRRGGRARRIPTMTEHGGRIGIGPEPAPPIRPLEAIPSTTPSPPPEPIATAGAPEDEVIDDLPGARRLYAAREYPRAVAVAERLVRTDGDDPGVWTLMVRSLANDGRLAEAGRACAAALDRHRTSSELMYLHAILLAESGRHADAAEAARRALYLDSSMAVAHLALGASLAHTAEREGARRAFRNAERLLGEMDPAATVPASDGEPAGRLREMARVQVALLEAPEP